MAERKMEDSMEISVVVPTYNRPHDVVLCVKSIFDQTALPREVIIIDDGDLSDDVVRQLKSFEKESVPVILSESRGPAGTSTARNTGVQIAKGDIVLILDDDVIISEDYIEQLKRDYETLDSPNLAGIGGFDEADLREPPFAERLFNAIFLRGRKNWDINRIGIQSWTIDIATPQKADWLSGNNASFKREVLSEYPYPHWSGGREAYEDVAIGLKLKKAGYHCIIDPELSLDHNEGEYVESPFKTGWKSGRNRVNIFFEYCDAYLFPIFIWAMLGEALRKFLAPVTDRRFGHHWKIGFGITAGALKQIGIKISNIKTVVGTTIRNILLSRN
ncbi:glycosyltransferase family 2 protein [Salarchaeum sp. JOR-1]|uniref:glycosyltransferase family 2 protein n=1 Tax=Salarchaeum sp. JOR-1 TaxID=2599399 RepID=UPI001198C76E|nr:glycosyltransferase family 2 protein [Salarchaeum sp. JOR-1]QDX40823.1 glycosyltransferase family 2 protein [Salarchaeum sp. JOR-1]